MTFYAISLGLLLGTFTSIDAAALPKMRAKPVELGSSIRDGAPLSKKKSSKSNYATFIGACSADTAFTFPLSSGSGRGSIGIMDYTASMSVDLGVHGMGEIHYTGDEQKGFMPVEKDDTTVMGFTYSGISAEGGTGVVSCNQDIEFIISYSDMYEYECEYSLETGTTLKAGSGETKNVESLKLETEASATVEVTAYTICDGHSANTTKAVESNCTDKGVDMEFDEGGDCVIAQIKEKIGSDTLYRSIVVMTESDTVSQSMNVESTSILENGDIELSFGGLRSTSTGRILIKSRLGVQIHDSMGKMKSSRDVVDTSAIVSDGKIVVHGGWVRAALAETPLAEGDLVDYVIVDAIAQDPENGYTVIGTLNQPFKAERSNDVGMKLLVTSPTVEEMNVSQEMKEGRRPLHFRAPSVQDVDTSRKLSSLSEPYDDGSYKSARILSHGYCSGSAYWPEQDFDYAIEFEDLEANRSHDTFANMLNDFAVDNGIVGCSIIGHSQGGCAALHLYNFYWSCLDSAQNTKEGGEGRLIQTLGTPFQGSPIAGWTASLAAIFGQSCGANDDLTVSGAAVWLETISMEARSGVYHYTTTYADTSWWYEYCWISVDPFMWWPDDGATEDEDGQLPGGNNMGLKYGYCHSAGAAQPPQCEDRDRNAEMNLHAAY